MDESKRVNKSFKRPPIVCMHFLKTKTAFTETMKIQSERKKIRKIVCSSLKLLFVSFFTFWYVYTYVYVWMWTYFVNFFFFQFLKSILEIMLIIGCHTQTLNFINFVSKQNKTKTKNETENEMIELFNKRKPKQTVLTAARDSDPILSRL